MSKSFGENLEELMRSRNLSARALAQHIGVSAKTAQQWVGPKGRMPRDAEVLRKLANYFECSVHRLLFGEDEPFGPLGEIFESAEIHTGVYEVTIKRLKTRQR